MSITAQQQSAITMLVKAVVETVNETPEGAPGGILYAALMAHGCSLSQFESLMGALVRLGKIRKQGDCYYPSIKVTDTGKEGIGSSRGIVREYNPSIGTWAPV